jgi:hypothetical protein
MTKKGKKVESGVFVRYFPMHVSYLGRNACSGMSESRHLSSRVESPVFPSRVKSSQTIFSIISFSVYFDKNIHKFFMTHYPVRSFYTQKNKNSPTGDKIT